MSESYQSKQERRQRLLESLPEGLRPHVSVRNIEAVVALSPQSDSSSTGQEVADLIQECFPDMPRVSAEALADADVMQVVRSVAEIHQQVFKSNHVKTDFVMLTLYGLMRQTLERLEEMIEETPALRQAFEKTNEWRKEETC